MGVKNLKFFKKNIVIVLLMVLTFNLGSSYFLARNSKQVQGAEIAVAVALGYAGVSFTAFTAFAQTVYFSGYHMQISEIMTSFINKYYDYANGVYIEKASAITVLEKLNLMTSAVLSGNNYMPLSELEALKSSVVSALPQRVDSNTIVSDFSMSSTSMALVNSYYVVDQAFAVIKPEYVGKYVKFSYQTTTHPDYYVYLKLSNIGWYLKSGIYYPTIQIIAPNGEVHDMVMQPYFRLANVNTTTQTFTVNTLNGTTINEPLFTVNGLYRDNYIPLGSTTEYTTTPDSYSSGTRAFDVPYGNYGAALNGLASTPDELKGLMETDQYLQREITKLLENQAVNDKNLLVAPVVAVDGTLNYGGVTDVPTDTTGSFSTALTGFWNNYLVNPVTGLWDTVKTLPGVISSAWDTSMDVPLESIQLSNLQLDGIITRFPFSIPFDFIRVLSVINVSPVAPDLSFNINTKYLKINHTIDSGPMDTYIKFFRWFVILTFTIGLMFLTGKVIKW